MVAGIPMQAETIRKYSTWFMIYGIVLILLGLFAIVAPGIATLATGLTVGWLLLISGIFGLVAVFSGGRSAPGFWWSLLTAILYALAGIALLWDPVAGALTLTIILAAYLIAAGAAKIVVAIGYRKAIPRAWGWMLASAVIDLLLGLMIIAGLPLTAVWALGLLVGVNLFFTGVALIAAAQHSRRLASAGVAHPA